MSYLAQLKALTAGQLSVANHPFEAFEGWSDRPISAGAVVRSDQNIDSFEGYGPKTNVSKRRRTRSIAAPKGPLRKPSKASKGPSDWQDGLNLLVDTPPPKGVSSGDWSKAIQMAVDFCNRFGLCALSCGWTEEQLFGLHPDAPLSRFDGMGVAFLGTDAVVVDVEPSAIKFRNTNGLFSRAKPPPNPQKAAWHGPWVAPPDP
jgi:hypothetical protein